MVEITKEFLYNLGRWEKADLGNGWLVESDGRSEYKFYFNSEYVHTEYGASNALEYANNLDTQGKEDIERNAVKEEFIAACNRIGTFRGCDFTIATFEDYIGGDSIRDNGGQRVVVTSITSDVIKKLGFNPKSIAEAFGRILTK